MLNFLKKSFQNSKEDDAKTVHPFLCDQVKQFGFCKGPCLKRHVLCKTLDKEVLNIPKKCFISIQLTQIHSASHFHGRILKYSTAKDPGKDKNWTNIDDSFEIIKDELKNAGSMNTKTRHTAFVIGEMVMVETIEKEFCRGVVLDFANGWFVAKVKVQLIDLGFTEEIDSKKIFILPTNLKKFRPVAVEIIISSMEPVEENCSSVVSWPTETTNSVRSLLQPIMLSDLELVCKVELTLEMTVWVDWILVKKCTTCSHFACKLITNALILPKTLIERNLAKTNSNLIKKLNDLNKDAQVWEEQIVEEPKNERKLLIQKQGISLFSCREKEPEINRELIVQWAHLSENIIYNVSVVYVENPKCILVCNLEFNESIYALQKDIDEAVKNKIVEQFTCATVGSVCLALSPSNNKYNRVLIKEINDRTADILYVDYGGIFRVNIETLLTIPSNLVTKLPFQIIECNLSGFKDILQTDIVDQFNDRLFQLTNTRIYLKMLSFSVDANLTKGNYYEVVLFNNDMNINTTMANEFNMFVDDVQIKFILCSNFKCIENESEDDETDEEEIQNQCDFFESLLNLKTNEKQISNPINSSKYKIANNDIKVDENQISSHSSKKDLISNDQQIIEPKKFSKTENKYCLDCNVTPVVPQCFWHQNNEWVYLKLNIISVNNHNISHTTDSITISAETNSVRYYFTAALYASITEELFTCRVSFDGIYIKAQKLLLATDQWPRLVKCSKRHKYIIYNTEYVTERKDWSLFLKELNKYKMKALNEPLNHSYDSDDDTSDDESDRDSMYED